MYLNCKTWFSFLYGTFQTEELVKTGVEVGATAMALTNINSTCDVWDFVDYCKQNGIKPVAGAEIRNDSTFLYILLAKNNKGFQQINRFISEHVHTKTDFPVRHEFSEDVLVIYALKGLQPEELRSNELIGIQPTEVNKLFNLNVNTFPDKYVIRQPVTFKDKTMYNVHRLLRAIDKNILLSKQGEKDIAKQHEKFVSQSSLVKDFAQYPSILTNTLKVLDSCSIDIEFHTDKTKKVYSADKKDDRVLLEKLAMDGMKQRYGNQE